MMNGLIIENQKNGEKREGTMYKDNINNDHDYNTPLYLFNYLNKHFKFALDPCDSGNKWLGLPYNFTKEDDGLDKDWKYNAFVNPPYGSKNEQLWITKTLREKRHHDTCNFILLPAKTESEWFPFCMLNASIIIFIQKRINFVRNGKNINGNIMGSVIFGFLDTYYGSFISTHGKRAEEFHYDNVRFNTKWYLGDTRSIIYFPDRDLLKEKYS